MKKACPAPSGLKWGAAVRLPSVKTKTAKPGRAEASENAAEPSPGFEADFFWTGHLLDGCEPLVVFPTKLDQPASRGSFSVFVRMWK